MEKWLAALILALVVVGGFLVATGCRDALEDAPRGDLPDASRQAVATTG